MITKLKAGVTIHDDTDTAAHNYYVTIESSGGSVFKNGAGASALKCVMFKSSAEEDAAKTASVLSSAPISPASGDLYYAIPGSGAQLALMKYDGSSWSDVTSSADYAYVHSYTWYRLDKNGAAMDGGAAWATGKLVYARDADVDQKTTFICKVDAATAQAQFTVYNMGDIVTSDTAPESPVSNMLWLDASVTPNQMKRYSGTEWIVVNDTTGLETQIEGVASNLETTNSNVTQNATHISWVVGGGTSQSNMTLTDKVYELASENINLNGKVSFNSLNADLASNFSQAGTSTVIDGGHIQTGSITAGSIATDGLYAQHIAAQVAAIVQANIDKANIGSATIDYAHVADLTAKVGSVADARIGVATIGGAQIEDATITAAKIEDGSITNAKIANATIEGAKIKNATIDTAQIANGAITTALIETGAVDTAQIADGSITDAKIVGLTANKITAGTIDAADIEVVNLNAANITVGTINGQQIASGAVVTDKLADDAVTSGKIAVDAVEAGAIKAGAVNEDKIAANSIAATHIQADAVTADKIVAAAVTADKIAASAVTANKIAANAVTTDKLNANAVTASKIAAGAIETSHISAAAGNALTLQAVSAVSTAGRNLVLDSGVEQIATCQYKTSALKPLTDYTVVIRGSVNSGQKIAVWIHDGTVYATETPVSDGTEQTYVLHITTLASSTDDIGLQSRPPETATSTSFKWICMYEGNIANPSLDWIPAPEDAGGRLTLAESKLSLHDGQILARVSQGELSKYLRFDATTGLSIGSSNTPGDNMTIKENSMVITQSGEAVAEFADSGMRIGDVRAERVLRVGDYAFRVSGADGSVTLNPI